MTLRYKGSTPEGHLVFASRDGRSVSTFRTLALARENGERTGNVFIGGEELHPLPRRAIGGPCGVFASGQIFVFNKGQQIPELQKPLLELWSERAEALGFDPVGVVIEDHIARRWRIRRREDGSLGTEFVE